jgi:hypothetical protein
VVFFRSKSSNVFTIIEFVGTVAALTNKENKMPTNTIAQAKRDFEIGYLTEFSLKRWPLAGLGWFVWLGKGNAAGWLVDARSKEPREFKTLDAAVSSLESIGFRIDELVRS